MRVGAERELERTAKAEPREPSVPGQRIQHVKQFATACSAELLKRGVDVANAYGCGAYGCVYPAGRGRVGKLSFDLGEAELAVLFARSRGAHPALPQVFYVAQLPARCGTYPRGTGGPVPLFLIIREDLADVSPAIEPEARSKRHGGPRAFGLLDAALMELDEADFPGFGEKVDLRLAALRAFPRALRFYQQAVTFAVWALERQIFLGDTHIDNWGLRDGRQIVLRDFGLASSPSAPSADSVPALNGFAGLGRSRRPRIVIRGLRR